MKLDEPCCRTLVSNDQPRFWFIRYLRDMTFRCCRLERRAGVNLRRDDERKRNDELDESGGLVIEICEAPGRSQNEQRQRFGDRNRASEQHAIRADPCEHGMSHQNLPSRPRMNGPRWIVGSHPPRDKKHIRKREFLHARMRDATATLASLA
ncbi:hypothetical protein [Caballeronia fortuita]|uniref:hypothetical protein n=1 Tax=Caballeronia fortuita TaxID=1777138 RepID=UPI0012FE571C|nr:hypothetical protein [Caballeronia fortuita]